MPLGSRRRHAEGRQRRFTDEMRFLKCWAGNPLTTGAVSPSSPALARAMAEQVDPDCRGPVVELGPGTGVVTKALLNRGVAADRLIALEFNPDFCRMLHRRFDGVTIVNGDAYDLAGALDGHLEVPPSAIVSSLPLFTKPPKSRKALIDSALEILGPGGPFIQFTYALVPPVRRSAGAYSITKSNWIPLNIPPARVWCYRTATTQ